MINAIILSLIVQIMSQTFRPTPEQLKTGAFLIRLKGFSCDRITGYGKLGRGWYRVHCADGSRYRVAKPMTVVPY